MMRAAIAPADVDPGLAEKWREFADALPGRFYAVGQVGGRQLEAWSWAGVPWLVHAMSSTASHGWLATVAGVTPVNATTSRCRWDWSA